MPKQRQQSLRDIQLEEYEKRRKEITKTKGGKSTKSQKRGAKSKG